MIKKTYKISYYQNGVKHSFTIKAYTRDEAIQKAYSKVDADDIYVDEVDIAKEYTVTWRK